MATTGGKKKVCTTGSGHNVVCAPEVSNNPPPPTAGPVPTPYPVKARSATGKSTKKQLTVAGKPVLTEASHCEADPPANQPSQPTAGDVQTHAVKGKVPVKSGASKLTAGGEKVSCTMDTCAVNVIAPQSEVAQQTGPLLGPPGGAAGGDDDEGDGDGDAPGAATKPAQGADEADAAAAKSAPDPPACRTCGEPVATLTGNVIARKLDLTLPGPIALNWQRSYSSRRRNETGMLGRGGWAVWCEQWVEPRDGALALRLDDGRNIYFDDLAVGETAFHRGERIELERTGASRFEMYALETRYVRSYAGPEDGRALLESIRDPHGNALTFDYEGERLVRIVDSCGRELRLQHGDEGRINRVEVWASAPRLASEVKAGQPPSPVELQTWFAYDYDNAGCLHRAVDALGNFEEYLYDAHLRRVAARLKNGHWFHYEYEPEGHRCIRSWGDGGLHNVELEFRDGGEVLLTGTPEARRYLATEDGFPLLEEAPDGSVHVENTFDDDRYVLSSTNGAGETVHYEYDERGNLAKLVDRAGNATEWTYDRDLVVKRRTPDGIELVMAYDEAGKRRSIQHPSGATWALEYTSRGVLSSLHGPSGLVARAEHDEHHNTSELVDARGNAFRIRYDALGRPIERVDSTGRTKRITYDRLSRVIRTEEPGGAVSECAYDAMDNLVEVRDAHGRTSRLEYAGTGVLTKVVDAKGQVTRFSYDMAERLRRIENPRGELYEFLLDRAGRVVEERPYDGRRLRYTWDLAGRPLRIERPDGTWRELEHDPLGNLVCDSSPHGTITFERDALGRMVAATFDEGYDKTTVELERDEFGRVVAEIQNGRRVGWTLDADDRPLTRELPNGTTTTYRYDATGDGIELAHAGQVVRFERDVRGRMVARTTSGFRETRAYDHADRLVSQIVTTPDSDTAHRSRTYERDRLGYPTRVEDDIFGATQYAHDEIGNLIAVQGNGWSEQFAYDGARSVVGPGVQTRPGNVLVQSGGAAFSSDACARRTERKDAEDLATQYIWDCRDQLREVRLPDGRTARYSYDAFGRRTKKKLLPAGYGDPERETEPPTAVEYVYDGNALCMELSSDGSERIHVMAPMTLLPVLQQEGQRVLSVLSDPLGQPIGLYDQSGQASWSAQPSGWREVRQEQHADPQQPVRSPFRSLGHYHDDETGFDYARHRYFDPSTARWCSPDPLGIVGGVNLFGFDGSPMRFVDPFGLEGCKHIQDKSDRFNFILEGDKGEGYVTPKVKAWVEDGTLNMVIVVECPHTGVRNPHMRAQGLYHKAANGVDGPYDNIGFNWQPELPSNLNQYNENRQNPNTTPEEAALNTWSGERARERGMNRATVHEDDQGNVWGTFWSDEKDGGG